MTPRSQFAKQLTEVDFAKLFKEAIHPREKMRFLAFIHLKEGKGPILLPIKTRSLGSE